MFGFTSLSKRAFLYIRWSSIFFLLKSLYLSFSLHVLTVCYLYINARSNYFRQHFNFLTSLLRPTRQISIESQTLQHATATILLKLCFKKLQLFCIFQSMMLPHEVSYIICGVSYSSNRKMWCGFVQCLIVFICCNACQNHSSHFQTPNRCEKKIVSEKTIRIKRIKTLLSF